MKKLVSLALALAMVLSLVAVSASAQDYSGYTIRIYSNPTSRSDEGRLSLRRRLRRSAA